MANDDMNRHDATSSETVAAVEGDSCGFYALRSGQRCRQPRSCYDCLNVPVASEPKGCFLSPYGTCEPMDTYSSTMDYRHNDSSSDNGDVANLNGGWWHAFPSVNSTYCQAQDPACVHCRDIALNASQTNSYMASTSKFCIGVSGCVCIVGCEAPTWRTRVQPDCQLASTPSTTIPPTTKGATGTQQLVWYLALAQLPIFVIGLTFRRYWLRCQRQARKSPTHRLELSGWRALHDQLVERDRNRPPHVETVLNSALPPLVPSATAEAARPPLMTRTERNVWGTASRSTSAT